MIRTLFLVLALCTGSDAMSRSQYNLSLVERTLSCIKEPVLHAFSRDEKIPGNTSAQPSLSSDKINPLLQDDLLPYYGAMPTPEIRKYQNSHRAPTRMITGGGAMAVGGIMLIAGYRQDTKYPWSGPSVSPSPLNVFGVLIAAVGLGLVVSGFLFYQKFKKHMIMPYNKAY